MAIRRLVSPCFTAMSERCSFPDRYFVKSRSFVGWMDGHVGYLNVSWHLSHSASRGFGNEMPNTPMVIMWTNSDGTVTLSQRKASGHVMPTVDQNPPRAASFDQTLSVVRQVNFRSR